MKLNEMCREIETLKGNLINFHKRRYKVYIEGKVGYMGNNPITQY